MVEDYNSRMEGSVVSPGQGGGAGGRLSRWSSRASGYSVHGGWH